MLLVRTRSSSNLCFDFSINLSKPVKPCHTSVFKAGTTWHNQVGCFVSIVLFLFFVSVHWHWEFGPQVELSLAKLKFWTSWPQEASVAAESLLADEHFDFDVPRHSKFLWVETVQLEANARVIICHHLLPFDWFLSSLLTLSCYSILFIFLIDMMMLVKMMLRSLAFLCSLIVAGISMSSLNNNSSSSNGLAAEQWNSLAA